MNDNSFVTGNIGEENNTSNNISNDPAEENSLQNLNKQIIENDLFKKDTLAEYLLGMSDKYKEEEE